MSIDRMQNKADANGDAGRVFSYGLFRPLKVPSGCSSGLTGGDGFLLKILPQNPWAKGTYVSPQQRNKRQRCFGIVSYHAWYSVGSVVYRVIILYVRIIYRV